MSAALLLITDGRLDYFEQAVRQAREFLPRFEQLVVVDDTAHKLGFAGAIQKGWDEVHTDWVFHLEDDFRFDAPVPVRQMIGLLKRQTQLVQVALKRQPWNAEEREAGGIVEARPESFHERFDGRMTWTEHRLFFTTNPSVYSARLCRIGWPQEPDSERVFTDRLLEDPLARFAFWGAKLEQPLVTHVGERVGSGY